MRAPQAMGATGSQNTCAGPWRVPKEEPLHTTMIRRLSPPSLCNMTTAPPRLFPHDLVTELEDQREFLVTVQNVM